MMNVLDKFVPMGKVSKGKFDSKGNLEKGSKFL
jgi:hypothetical protein